MFVGKSRNRLPLALTAATLFVLACSLAAAPSSNAPAFDPTKAALELQATQMSLQLTQAAACRRCRRHKPCAVGEHGPGGLRDRKWHGPEP